MSNPESVEVDSLKGLRLRLKHFLGDLAINNESRVKVIARHRWTKARTDSPDAWKQAVVSSIADSKLGVFGIEVGPDERTDEEYKELSLENEVVFWDRVTINPIVSDIGSMALVHHVYLGKQSGKPVEYRAVLWQSLQDSQDSMNGRRARVQEPQLQ